MLQEIPDIDAIKRIVRFGIIPAIQNEIDKDDVYRLYKLKNIKKLIDAYFDFVPKDNNFTMKDFYTGTLTWRKYSEEQEKKDVQEDKTMVVEEDSCD